MSVNRQADTLLEEFRNRTRRRAGSLIMTVFGDAVAPRGGTVWVGSLIAALEGFGVSERLVRTAVFRLARDGWLQSRSLGRRSYYELTAGGARRFERATQRIYGEPRPRWSGEWCLLVLSALSAGQRDTLRRELGWLGFGAIGGSLFVHPAPDQDALADVLDRYGASESAVVATATTAGNGQDRTLTDLAGKSWDLAAIDADYASLLARFRPVFDAVSRAGGAEPYAAFVIRTLLIHDYRRALLRDPALPRDLLPDDWHGLAAYTLCRDLYVAVHAAADEWLGAHLQTVDGSLPPPGPSYYHRFGGLGTAAAGR